MASFRPGDLVVDDEGGGFYFIIDRGWKKLKHGEMIEAIDADGDAFPITHLKNPRKLAQVNPGDIEGDIRTLANCLLDLGWQVDDLEELAEGIKDYINYTSLAEPKDLSARIQDREELVWALFPKNRMWVCLGRAQGPMTWDMLNTYRGPLKLVEE